MHPNENLITSFYAALQRRDAAAMNACYSAEARFEDEVFSLDHGHVRDMWSMLCERGKDLRIEFRDVVANDSTGSAHWEAWYTFTTTGRKVHNVIEAQFTFGGGLIASHTDRFNFHRWAAQALGTPGKLFGWLPPFQSAVRKKSAAALDAWVRKHRSLEA